MRRNRNTVLFLSFLLLAGAANVFSRIFGPAPASLMTALNYVILTGLILFWIQSVRVRLLPSAARNSVLAAAFLMLFYMLIRIFKYRFAVEPLTLHYATYVYWIPQILIPALFLMTCIRIRRGEETVRKKWEYLLLIPAFLLAASVMANDLHFLVYRPKIALQDFTMNTTTYTCGPVFYLLYGWMVLTLVSGFVLLLREARHMPKRVFGDLLLVITLWAGIALLNILYLDPHSYYRPFNVPDAHTFGLMGIFEVCIRYRLIPFNENYTGFFRALRLPVLITDRQLQPVYRTEVGLQTDGKADHTETGLPAEAEIFRKAAEAPVALPEDRILHGKQIRSGFAFWTEDESGIRRAQEKLQEANETIEHENDLIQAETRQKEKDAYLRSRHRIYHEIAEELYPVQQRISQLLESAEPGTDGFRETIAKVSVLNAYVKRKTNLLLLAAEKERLGIDELALALQESAYYLTLSGLRTMARIPEGGTLPADRIVALYDAFESLAEQLSGKAPSLMVSWNGEALRLAAETNLHPVTEGIMLPVRFLESEDILYMDIASGKEATA